MKRTSIFLAFSSIVLILCPNLIAQETSTVKQDGAAQQEKQQLQAQVRVVQEGNRRLREENMKVRSELVSARGLRKVSAADSPTGYTISQFALLTAEQMDKAVGSQLMGSVQITGVRPDGQPGKLRVTGRYTLTEQTVEELKKKKPVDVGQWMCVFAAEDFEGLAMRIGDVWEVAGTLKRIETSGKRKTLFLKDAGLGRLRQGAPVPTVSTISGGAPVVESPLKSLAPADAKTEQEIREARIQAKLLQEENGRLGEQNRNLRAELEEARKPPKAAAAATRKGYKIEELFMLSATEKEAAIGSQVMGDVTISDVRPDGQPGKLRVIGAYNEGGFAYWQEKGRLSRRPKWCCEFSTDVGLAIRRGQVWQVVGVIKGVKTAGKSETVFLEQAQLNRLWGGMPIYEEP